MASLVEALGGAATVALVVDVAYARIDPDTHLNDLFSQLPTPWDDVVRIPVLVAAALGVAAALCCRGQARRTRRAGSLVPSITSAI